MSEKVMEYLTMTRIMNKEWEKWKKRTPFQNMTGMEIHISQEAYKAGFMAGFEGKYFGEKND
jgi:hypothetical protein